MTAAQIGKTEILNNVVGYFVEQDPAPMLVLQPTIEMAEAWSKDRLAPMIRDTPALVGLVKDPRSRDSGNTLRHKVFPGGHITMAGANSPASLAMRPIRILLGDEVDRYPHSAGTEGDPIELARKRTANFWNRKQGFFSTPTHEGSRIHALYLESDRRQFWVPCPECETEQLLTWANVLWDKGPNGEHLTDTAKYVCGHCGVPWSEAQRLRAVRRGRWIASAPFHGVAGFHLNALYSPWVDLRQLARDFVASKHDNERKRVFINTALAEVWSEKYKTLEPDGLEARCERYPRGTAGVLVPRGVAVITAGVDIQDDRIEVQIQGYGLGHEQWKLRYHVLEGDPSAPEIWSELWELLLTPLPMERGGVDFVRATCVDTGAHTLRAYDFCKPRFSYRTVDGRRAYVFAIKGSGGETVQGEGLWPRHPNRNNKGHIPLYTIKVDCAKEDLYGALEKVTAPGPHYVHFPREVSAGLPFDARYFDQLTAESVSVKRSPNGAVRRVWELRSANRRNEALDTSVYGEAALRGLISMGLDLERESLRLAAAPALTVAEPAAAQPPAPPSAPPKTAPRAGRRRSTSPWLER